VSLTRSYVYDANERLCKVINPESGATVYAYDGASNVLWTAEGSALTANTCDRDSVPVASRIVRQYDNRNRVEYLDYPDTTADIAYSYEVDGALKTISTGGNEWSYAYNNRRLQTQESLQVDVDRVNSYNIGYSYNANGHLSAMTYPDSTSLAYAPNALGQPMQAGSYASGIRYHPNGAIAQFTYGNGIVHTMTPNARQLPANSFSSGAGGVVINDSYTYDANGNVTDIEDRIGTGTTTRGMSYDDLDRLRVAVAPGLWGTGTASYTYTYLCPRQPQFCIADSFS